MKNGLRAFGIYFIFMCCFGATDAFAQSDRSGFELRAGLVIPIFSGASTVVDDYGLSGKALSAVGVGVDIQAMYRWAYFGLGVQQTIAGVFATNDTLIDIKYGEVKDFFRKGDGAFYGGSFFMLKEYIPFAGNHMITIGEGIGVTYGANKENRKLYSSDSDLALAIKGDLGYVYFIEGIYGVGLNIDCTLSFALGNGVSTSYAVTPSVVFDMVF